MYFKRLYELRCDNDLTQQQVADYLVCNRQVYARYEQGKREIPVSMIIKLAKLYNTSADYILELKDK
ncbi:MAG: helix-turn-helix transcriptional regulator [Clostridia bacterium]|nr:helix-turn-helix transcriptional regulator [Clostridia bacterium]